MRVQCVGEWCTDFKNFWMFVIIIEPNQEMKYKENSLRNIMSRKNSFTACESLNPIHSLTHISSSIPCQHSIGILDSENIRSSMPTDFLKDPVLD